MRGTFDFGGSVSDDFLLLDCLDSFVGGAFFVAETTWTSGCSSDDESDTGIVSRLDCGASSRPLTLLRFSSPFFLGRLAFAFSSFDF